MGPPILSSDFRPLDLCVSVFVLRGLCLHSNRFPDWVLLARAPNLAVQSLHPRTSLRLQDLSEIQTFPPFIHVSSLLPSFNLRSFRQILEACQLLRTDVGRLQPCALGLCSWLTSSRVQDQRPSSTLSASQERSTSFLQVSKPQTADCPCGPACIDGGILELPSKSTSESSKSSPCLPRCLLRVLPFGCVPLLVNSPTRPLSGRQRVEPRLSKFFDLTHQEQPCVSQRLALQARGGVRSTFPVLHCPCTVFVVTTPTAVRDELLPDARTASFAVRMAHSCLHFVPEVGIVAPHKECVRPCAWLRKIVPFGLTS